MLYYDILWQPTATQCQAQAKGQGNANGNCFCTAHFDLDRKRKPRSEHVYRRVRTMWDVDTESTTSLLEDMGVAMLDDDDSVPMPTPPSHIQRDVLPPGVGCVRVFCFPVKPHLTEDKCELSCIVCQQRGSVARVLKCQLSRPGFESTCFRFETWAISFTPLLYVSLKWDTKTTGTFTVQNRTTPLEIL